jgi:hypothetical protein
MMSEELGDEGPERFRSYVEAKQRNIDWTDTLRNSSSVDALLWKGSERLTKIQRAGIWAFAMMFLFAGIGLAFVAWEQRTGFALLLAAFSILIAARLIRNACRRNSPKDRDEEL